MLQRLLCKSSAYFADSRAKIVASKLVVKIYFRYMNILHGVLIIRHHMKLYTSASTVSSPIS